MTACPKSLFAKPFGIALLLGTIAACGNVSNTDYCDEATPCPTNFACDLTTKLCEPVGDETCETSSECTGVAPYCAGAVDDLTCQAACSGNASCVGAPGAAGPRCDDSDGTCVTCIPDGDGSAESGDCDSDAPVCDVGSRECRGCTENYECGSGVCNLESTGGNGTCVPASSIVYVDAGSTANYSTGSCTQAAPCKLESVVASAPPNSLIGLLPGEYLLATTLTISKTFSLKGLGTVAGDVVINRVGGGNGAVISSLGGDIDIRDLTITGGDGSSGKGFDCVAGSLVAHGIIIRDNGSSGIRSSSSCTLDIAKSVISGNEYDGIEAAGVTTITSSKISNNNGDGVFSSALLNVVGSVFADNGFIGIYSRGILVVDKATVSGNQLRGIYVDSVENITISNSYIVENGGTSAAINIANAAAQVSLRFNTIALNDGSGLFCSANISAKNNIVYGNAVGAGGTQVPSSCGSFTNGDANHNYTGMFSNSNPLKFLNSGDGSDKYHLTEASTVVLGAGIPIAGIATDFDGDARDATAPDIGADEFVQ